MFFSLSAISDGPSTSIRCSADHKTSWLPYWHTRIAGPKPPPPYRTALAGMSGDADLHDNLGFALMRLGDAEEATNHFQQASAVSRKVASFSSPLSEGGFKGVLRSPKNLPQPLLEKEESKKPNDLLGNGTSAVNPNNGDAHFNLARLLASEARESEANEHFSKAATLDTRHAAILGQSN